jgi:hypothetical protein
MATAGSLSRRPLRTCPNGSSRSSGWQGRRAGSCGNSAWPTRSSSATGGAFGTREPGTGSLTEIRDDIKRLLGLGFDTIIVRHRGGSAAEQMHQIERFITDIAARA